MDNLLLHLALLTVGTHGLIIGAVLLTVPVYLDRPYVDVGPFFVVLIIDTTYSLSSSGVPCQQPRPAGRLFHHDAEVVGSVVLLFLDGHLQDVLS